MAFGTWFSGGGLELNLPLHFLVTGIESVAIDGNNFSNGL